MSDDHGHRHRIQAVARSEDRVTALELFFDLVFVLAITQCTALMAHDPTWTGVGRGLLVLALLWWSWVGYAWLTSVLDPEEGAVRGVLFAAMAAMLVAALCIPEVFGDLGLTFALAYGSVRVAHIALFVIASHDEPEFRRSVVGLGIGTAIGVALLAAGGLADGDARVAIWCVALLLDMGEPFFFGADGWKLMPAHFAERHGLIVLIALGESIVAIGVGAEAGVDGGVIAGATLGMAVAAAQWWLYFDVLARAATRRLEGTEVGRAQNELARDAYSYLHFPLVAAIVVVALGMKFTLAHVDEPLGWVASTALVGGAALYVTGLSVVRWRNIGSLSGPRLVAAAVLLAVLPLAQDLDALVLVAITALVLWSLVLFEARHYAELRDRVRHEG